MTSMASSMVALLAALSLLAQTGRAAPGVRQHLGDMKLVPAECPVRVQIEIYAELVPRRVKTFTCDWKLISERKLQDCVELQDTAVFFTRRQGVRIERDISVGCVLVPGRRSEALIIGDAE